MLRAQARRHRALDGKFLEERHDRLHRAQHVERVVPPGNTEGWLVLFDLRKEPAWAEKVFVRGVTHEAKAIHIVGC